MAVLLCVWLLLLVVVECSGDYSRVAAPFAEAPPTCSSKLEPVEGRDGQVYVNKCIAESQGVKHYEKIRGQRARLYSWPKELFRDDKQVSSETIHRFEDRNMKYVASIHYYNEGKSSFQAASGLKGPPEGFRTRKRPSSRHPSDRVQSVMVTSEGDVYVAPHKITVLPFKACGGMCRAQGDSGTVGRGGMKALEGHKARGLLQGQWELSRNHDRPWSFIGTIEPTLSYPGFCTATLIAPQIVVTAASCIFDKRIKQQWTSPVTFSPGRRGEDRRGGPIKSAAFAAQDQYVQDENPAYNVAVILLEEPIFEGAVGVGFFPYQQWCGGNLMSLRSTGYQRDTQMWTQGCGAASISPGDNCHALDGVLYHWCTAALGSAGSPMWYWDGDKEMMIGIGGHHDYPGVAKLINAPVASWLMYYSQATWDKWGKKTP